MADRVAKTNSFFIFYCLFSMPPSTKANTCAVRGPGWTDEEDEWLCEAWIALTNDAVNGTDQNSNTFWGAVYDDFIRRGGDNGVRTSTGSLSSRWGTINREVSKFVGCLSKVLGPDQRNSGLNDEDKVKGFDSL